MFKKLIQMIKGKPEPILENYSNLTVDLHSHLIPGIDDGSKSLDESMSLIREMHALGFKKIITTPHIMSGGYDNGPNTILPGRDVIKEAISKEGLDVDFEAAAEYYADEHFVKLLEKKDLLTFGNNHILFEWSFLTEPNNAKDIIFKINTKGFKGILAHPERYSFYHGKNLDSYREVKELGVYFQLNISSLTGIYGPAVKKASQMLIDEEMVDFVASDLHNHRHLDMLKRALQEPYLEKIVNSGNLLNKSLL